MRRDLSASTTDGSTNDVELLFESLFKKHEHAIYRLALRVTKSQVQAGDLVQDVFLKLWEHRDEIENIRNMDAWLSRVVKNKLIDYLRKASADERMKARLWQQISPSSHEAGHELEAKESTSIINRAVEELPPQRKLVYRLNRETGLSYQQIADELSISRHTVKNQLSTALRFLQKKFSFE